MSASELQPQVITANPLGSADLIAPATSLGGTGLLLRAQPTLAASRAVAAPSKL